MAKIIKVKELAEQYKPKDGAPGATGPQGPVGKDGSQGKEGPSGPPGKDGKAFRWRGNFKDEEKYYPYDVVNYQGSVYVATKENIRDYPNRVNNAWDLMAAAGASGASGSGGGSSTFSGLDDVTLTSAAQGDILYYSGTEWVNLGPGTNGHFLKTQGTDANPTWAPVPGGGDMLVSTYDPIGVNEQLVGLSASQTLTNKTVTSPILNLTQGTTPTAEGRIEWDATNDVLKVGDGTGTVTFSNDTDNAATYAAASHTHTASDVTDFDTEVSNNASVVANTAKLTADATNVGNALTLTGDVTSSGSFATTISAKAVDVAMLADGTDGELITWDATGVAATVPVGTSGHVLTSNGTGAAPTFQAAATAAQGALADSAVQPNDSVTTLDGTAHRLFYTDGSGDITELAYGTSGQYLQSQGATSAPTWGTAGAGDVTKVSTPVNNQLGVWTGDGTLEGDPELTWDETTLTAKAPAGSPGTLLLQTAETTVVDGDLLGRIDFQSPDESGADATAVSASIWAEADNTFSPTTNETDMVFALGVSEAATEKARLKHEGGFTLTTGSDYEINNTSVLNATTLGSGVTGSSLTSVGAVSTGTWSSTVSSATIDADNNTITNIHIGNEATWNAINDVSDRSAFAAGDKVLIFEAGVGMRKVDYADLPGAGGGISAVVDDTGPTLGGDLNVSTFEIVGAIDLHSTGDIIQELGDAAGTNKVIIKDSGAVEVAAIDSDGNITTSGTVDGRDVLDDGQAGDNLITLSGVARDAVNLGSFTGSTIADNQTVKVALQSLETEVETKIDNTVATLSSLANVGALNSGSITSGFGNIDNGSSTITTTGDITGGGIIVTGDTAAADTAALGYTATEGLILTGQGSTNDVTIKNDADTQIMGVLTGTTTAVFAGEVRAGTMDLANIGLTGSLAEFNTALQSDSFVSLTGTETLTNKTLTKPKVTLNVPADITGGTYTPALGDQSSFQVFNAAGASTCTWPTNASVTYPIGTAITMMRKGAGSVTITGNTGVTIHGSDGTTKSAGAYTISNQYGVVTMVKIDTDVWSVSGTHSAIT